MPRFRPFLVVALIVLGLGSSWAHQVEGGNLQLIAELEDEYLLYDVSAETSLVPPLAEITAESESFPSKESIAESLTAYFAEHCPVRIDGIEVAPVLEEIDFQKLENQVNLGEVTDFVMSYFLMKYPVKTKPQTVDMRWGIYLPDRVKDLVPQVPDPTGHEPQMVDTIFYTFGELDLVVFSPKEPQYIWHSPKPVLSVDAEARLQAAMAAVSAASQRFFPLGWVLAGLMLGLTILLGLLGNRGVALACAGVAVALGAAHGALKIPLPREPERLTAEAALQRFQDLHQNIYRAFDYDTDEAIYDTLAQSVSGELLEEIYSDVYKSLVMKEDGGAVCRVKQLEYLDCLPSPLNDGETGFAFDCQWRVHGLVQHWGHTHERVNEYAARYVLSQVDDWWRITDVEVTREKRLDAQSLEVVN